MTEVVVEAKDCSVCAEKFTNNVRSKISCGYCSYNACKTCVTRYLLSQVSEPHCMNCKTGWNNEFLDANLNKSFVKGPLRDNKKKIYMNREKALLPNFQQFAAAKKKMEEIVPKLMEANKTLSDVEISKNKSESKLHYTQSELYNSNTENEQSIIEKLNNDLKIYNNSLLEYTITRMKHFRIANEYQLYFNIYNNGVKKEERKEFIMKCVKEDCRGFLSQAYKCELCSTYVCKDCMIPKKDKNDITHECKKEDVESVALIRKESKPCPKCGIRISKIDGCDQMWCTADNCKTAFSWNSGKIINGTIHNPHFYEWLRRNNNGEIPRNPGDIPCGGFPGYDAFVSNLRTLYANNFKKDTDLIYAIHRCFMDIQDYRIPLYRTTREPMMFKDIHVDYLLGNITEDKWVQSIFMKELNIEKRQAVLAVIQTFLGAGQDLFRGLVNNLDELSTKTIYDRKFVITIDNFKPILDILKQFNTLREYINDCLIKTGESVSTPVPQIDEWWYWIPAASVEKIKASKEAENTKK